MQPINKRPFRIISVTFSVIIIASIGVSHHFKVETNLHEGTRLAVATASEPQREVAQEAVQGIVEERSVLVYPQPVDNSHPMRSKEIKPKDLVTHRATSRGYNQSELKCLFEIIDRESSWNPKADNPSSTAFGLFQRLKLDPNASLKKQVRTGLDYVEARYGTACAALKHHDIHGWY